jgi:hypothetical protein
MNVVNVQVRRATTRNRAAMAIASECLLTQSRRYPLLRPRNDVATVMDRAEVLPVTLRALDRRR